MQTNSCDFQFPVTKDANSNHTGLAAAEVEPGEGSRCAVCTIVCGLSSTYSPLVDGKGRLLDNGVWRCYFCTIRCELSSSSLC